MTTATANVPTTLDLAGTTQVPLRRLFRLELRKMVDTRSGFWLMLVTGILLVLAMAITLLVAALDDNAGLTSSNWAMILSIPTSLLIPLFGILTTTSEWSQRTHLVTFTAEPNRGRVVLAKFLAVVTVALSTMLLAIVLGAIGNVVSGAISGQTVWDFGAGELVGAVAVQVLFFLMAFGLGMVLLNTPGAVSLFYVFGLLLPFMVYTNLYFAFDWARDVIPFIDLQAGTMPLVADEDYRGDAFEGGAQQHLQTATSIVLWVVVPLLVGFRRVLRAEVK